MSSTKKVRSFAFLRGNADSRKEGVAASQLLEHLGNLPLAIEQAGAYIYTSSMHISRYLEVYTKNAKGLLENAPIIWNYRNDMVLSTWEISFAAIEKRHPKAASILLLSGFLARNDLWMDLFQWGLTIRANGRSPACLNDTILANQPMQTYKRTMLPISCFHTPSYSRDFCQIAFLSTQ